MNYDLADPIELSIKECSERLGYDLEIWQIRATIEYLMLGKNGTLNDLREIEFHEYIQLIREFASSIMIVSMWSRCPMIKDRAISLIETGITHHFPFVSDQFHNCICSLFDKEEVNREKIINLIWGVSALNSLNHNGKLSTNVKELLITLTTVDDDDRHQEILKIAQTLTAYIDELKSLDRKFLAICGLPTRLEPSVFITTAKPWSS